jgi:flagellar assembly protein FliH
VERQEALEIDELERALAETATVLAEAVIGAELQTGNGVVYEAVRRGLSLAPRTGAVTVRLHPDDADQLPAHQLDQLAGGRPITLVADPSVEMGGCLVEVGACTVDAQLSTALDRVRAELGLDPRDR